MRKLIFVAALLGLASCTGMTTEQKQAALTLAVQQGATLASALGGPQAQLWINAGGLVCQVGNRFVAGLGVNVQGTAGKTMEALCNGLGGSGTALPASINPADVFVAIIQSLAAKK